MFRLCSGLLLFAFAACASAETLYVNSKKAPLLSSPAFNGDVLLVLDKGNEVTLIESDQRWLKVEFENQQGWVSALLLKENPPLNKVNLIGSDALTLEGEARRRASAVATAGATRGLTEGESLEGLQSDYQELKKMEALQVSDEELALFAYELSEAER